MHLTHSTHGVFSSCLFKPSQGSPSFSLNFLILARLNFQFTTMHSSLSRSDVHNDKHHAFFLVEIRCYCTKFALFRSSSCIIQLDVVAHNVCKTFSQRTQRAPCTTHTGVSIPEFPLLKGFSHGFRLQSAPHECNQTRNSLRKYHNAWGNNRVAPFRYVHCCIVCTPNHRQDTDLVHNRAVF